MSPPRAAPPRAGRLPPAAAAAPTPAWAHLAARHGYRLTLLALWAGGAVSVGIWWFSGAERVRSFGGNLTDAGRITGMVAGYLCAVLLLLMARVPVMERFVGADRLAGLHSKVGRYTVSLLVAHTLLLVWGYAVTAHQSVVSQSWSLLRSYPDVLMATVGVLLLVGVGILSARAVRKRVRYETWYLLHLYTYLGVGLSFAHTFADGQEFVNNRGARILWTTLYVVCVGALVGYRILQPAVRAYQHRLTVTHVQREAPGVTSIYIGGPRVAEIKARSGQFLRLRFLTPDGWWQSHPFSLSAAPNPAFLRVSVKELGDHTRALQRLRKGTKVVAEGPYGAFTDERRTRRKVLLIGGGIGITPVRALFESMPVSWGDLTLLYRSNTKGELVFRDELDHIAAARGAELHYLVGPPAAGAADPISAVRIRELVPDVTSRDVFVCGPAGLMGHVVRQLRSLGVHDSRIHLEDFDLTSSSSPRATAQEEPVRRALLALTATVAGVVLLLGYKTSSAAPVRTVAVAPAGSASTPTPTDTAAAGAGGGASTPTPSTAAPKAAGRSGTFTGTSIDTPFGPVQVKVTLTRGRIVDVQEVQVPTGGRSDEINSYAGPVLRQEVLAAQSANIDVVSGATYTSDSYAQSLQSALDQAR